MTFLGSCPVVAALLMSAATDGIAQTPLAGDWRPRPAAGGIGPPLVPKAGLAATATVRSQDAEIRHIFADAGGRATVRSFIYALS